MTGEKPVELRRVPFEQNQIVASRSRVAAKNPTLHQLQDQPHHAGDEDHDQHYPLFGFQGLRETDDPENGKSERNENEQHDRKKSNVGARAGFSRNSKR